MEITDFKSGFVSIIGKPNVGKSTLLNKLIGEKLSIVTPKPQTTRLNIKGILHSTQSQIIFLDTPGFLTPRYELQKKMLNYLMDSLKNCDVILFLADGTNYPSPGDEVLISLIEKTLKPKICLFNKADLLTKEIIHTLSIVQGKFNHYFIISALQDINFSAVLKSIEQYLPYSPPLYNQDELSDLPMRFFVQEIIREKIFLRYGEEIPYCSTVVVEKFLEEEDHNLIYANIYLERDSQKPILIGKGGKKIGELRRLSEKDISNITGKKTVLNLWVKIKKDWRKKKGALHEFGYK